MPVDVTADGSRPREHFEVLSFVRLLPAWMRLSAGATPTWCSRITSSGVERWCRTKPSRSRALIASIAPVGAVACTSDHVFTGSRDTSGRARSYPTAGLGQDRPRRRTSRRGPAPVCDQLLAQRAVERLPAQHLHQHQPAQHHIAAVAVRQTLTGCEDLDSLDQASTYFRTASSLRPVSVQIDPAPPSVRASHPRLTRHTSPTATKRRPGSKGFCGEVVHGVRWSTTCRAKSSSRRCRAPGDGDAIVAGGVEALKFVAGR